MRTFLINAWRESSTGRWWRTKAAQEQMVYAALVAAMTVALLWMAVWLPLADWHAQEMRRHDNAQRLLEWVTLNEDRARAAANGAGQRAPGAGQRNEAGTGSILPTITQAAETAGIRLARLQPESGGAVSVSLEQQSFDQVVAWLATLSDGSGVRVVQASMDAHRAPGFINAQLRLAATP